MSTVRLQSRIKQGIEHVTWPSASHSAGLLEGYRPDLWPGRLRVRIPHRKVRAALMQIINPLGIGTAVSYSASWVGEPGG